MSEQFNRRSGATRMPSPHEWIALYSALSPNETTAAHRLDPGLALEVPEYIDALLREESGYDRAIAVVAAHTESPLPEDRDVFGYLPMDLFKTGRRDEVHRILDRLIRDEDDNVRHSANQCLDELIEAAVPDTICA